MFENFCNQTSLTLDEVEDVILGMAEIVYENRSLRREVIELREIREKYYRESYQRCVDSQRHSENMLKLAYLISGEKIGELK